MGPSVRRRNLPFVRLGGGWVLWELIIFTGKITTSLHRNKEFVNHRCEPSRRKLKTTEAWIVGACPWKKKITGVLGTPDWLTYRQCLCQRQPRRWCGGCPMALQPQIHNHWTDCVTLQQRYSHSFRDAFQYRFQTKTGETSVKGKSYRKGDSQNSKCRNNNNCNLCGDS